MKLLLIASTRWTCLINSFVWWNLMDGYTCLSHLVHCRCRQNADLHETSRIFFRQEQVLMHETQHSVQFLLCNLFSSRFNRAWLEIQCYLLSRYISYVFSIRIVNFSLLFRACKLQGSIDKNSKVLNKKFPNARKFRTQSISNFLKLES